MIRRSSARQNKVVAFGGIKLGTVAYHTWRGFVVDGSGKGHRSEEEKCESEYGSGEVHCDRNGRNELGSEISKGEKVDDG